ncbi:MAG: TatD family hydrolase [Candidatus Marinimicrobia bacterium]|nr:TatD family hydrolase [Candidatus Neomarinimicrobiota bacterium]
MIDTHAHLFYRDFEGQLESVIQRAWDAGLSHLICVGLNLATSEQAINIAEKHDHVWATVGVHPHDAGAAPVDYLAHLERMASHEKVVAIGEMGLDFFRNLTPPERQIDVFREQLALARSLNLPAIIHSRQADDAIFETVSGIGHHNAVVHCFSSAADFARKMVDMGLHISFTGTVTFGKNHNAAALQEVGLEKVMVETDCPYLAPVPMRGKTNEPSYLPHTVSKIAEICSLPAQEVADITSRNARAFFGLQNGEVQP